MQFGGPLLEKSREIVDIEKKKKRTQSHATVSRRPKLSQYFKDKEQKQQSEKI